MRGEHPGQQDAGDSDASVGTGRSGSSSSRARTGSFGRRIDVSMTCPCQASPFPIPFFLLPFPFRPLSCVVRTADSKTLRSGRSLRIISLLGESSSTRSQMVSLLGCMHRWVLYFSHQDRPSSLLRNAKYLGCGKFPPPLTKVVHVLICSILFP